jgi:hypothetical protein
MAEEIVQYSRQAPFIEERAEQLLGSIYGIPNYQQQAGETEEEYQLRLEGSVLLEDLMKQTNNIN